MDVLGQESYFSYIKRNEKDIVKLQTRFTFKFELSNLPYNF